MISKWANTQTVCEVACPKCHADMGEGCKTPKGKYISTIHGVRGESYLRQIGRAEWMRRHSMIGGIYDI